MLYDKSAIGDDDEEEDAEGDEKVDDVVAIVVVSDVVAFESSFESELRKVQISVKFVVTNWLALFKISKEMTNEEMSGNIITDQESVDRICFVIFGMLPISVLEMSF
ncbi:uncharacterized protein MONOS_8089 [Monocercomonoides exilis]|uniref:uncharacterized protein n=1 Tax=Monocercomonoides exilis TaxID=2049356 RepID=UPI003559F102|nr:hypothetical protein MONOS_8089 [Monocercomonoides exilis]|eukprot:MONOS_8089.1-p1 / transcript=MONOS_8089.1 / gene=MONOS_8089 / organism=Monocercomonoides_exilis_PA203 / gene_product=unspecified product / transcript_product=unspecified product / location=Mono_scaffold00295:44058-44378(+) / protein_length=107 / sequence_SO=supercontig / SO=protein_coding / is_pseudo=false